jgi:uncharacterized iron-regulated protein
MNRVPCFVLFLVFLLAAAAPAAAADRSLDLPIGDPARKDRVAPLVLDGVTDTATGEVVTPAEMAARLRPVRLLFVGESHTNADFHRAQLRVIQELHRAGRRVLVGLEMFPAGEQSQLDQWVDGSYTEAGFLNLAHWYKSWGYHWDYYRDIFTFARENKLRMLAVNAPRDLVNTVRRKGFAALSPEETALLPPRIDLENAEHKQLFRSFFDEDGSMHSGMSEEMWDAMFRAHCTWDATMGHNAVRALKADPDPKTIVVVLIGAGHVAYGLGAERQARLWFDGRTASLIPLPVQDEEDRPVKVRASYANFLWGVPADSGPLYPVLGVSTPETKQGEHYTVIAVAKDSVGAKAGFQTGDKMVAMDGVPITDKETWNRLMAGKRWGDAATYEVKRGEQSLTLKAVFRRTPREAKAAE